MLRLDAKNSVTPRRAANRMAKKGPLALDGCRLSPAPDGQNTALPFFLLDDDDDEGEDMEDEDNFDDMEDDFDDDFEDDDFDDDDDDDFEDDDYDYEDGVDYDDFDE